MQHSSSKPHFARVVEGLDPYKDIVPHPQPVGWFAGVQWCGRSPRELEIFCLQKKPKKKHASSLSTTKYYVSNSRIVQALCVQVHTTCKTTMGELISDYAP